LSAGPAETVAGWTPMSAPGWQNVVTAVPSGWLLDAGTTVPCRGLPAPRQSLVVSARHDFTVSFRAAQFDSVVDRRQAAAQCGTRGSAAGDGSYRSTFSRLGIAYSVEGVFQPAGARVAQLEVVAPTAKFAATRELFARWLNEQRRTP
jgi:hypothetical protein